jgi:hypothetical protein
LVASEDGRLNGAVGPYRVPNTFAKYLRDLSQSYFCISPNGNGIDCHRTWESLYVRTIPIVTDSLVAKAHADFPMMVLKDWSEFKSIDFSRELYEKIWSGFDIANLHLECYLAKRLPHPNR